MARKTSVRWAFNLKNWIPTEEELLLASSYIQPEEKSRISRFVFQDDAKSSLIGRLMLRKFIHLATYIPYENICLDRDNHGKPVCKGRETKSPYFNISHQGDYVVLVGDSEYKVGIDVMKIEPPHNKDITEFFRIMARQFSASEWETIKSFQSEADRVASFYRHWCLKESYVKNIGVGITVNLADISFYVKSCTLKSDRVTTDTELYVRNVKKDNWVFEETMLDAKHTVAVAYEVLNVDETAALNYTFLTYKEIVNEAKSLFEPDDIFKDCFIKKEMKPF